MVPSGKAITFIVVGSTGEWIPRTADDVRSQAIRGLEPYGLVESLGVQRNPGYLIREFWDWGYTAEVRLRTTTAYGDIQDLLRVVRDVFWSAAGEPPTVSADGYQDQLIPDTGGTEKKPGDVGAWGVGLFLLALAAVVVGTGVFAYRKAA